MNSCCFSGNLTADPELRQTPDGTSICTFCLGIGRPYSNDKTDFLYFTAWRQNAEYLCKYGHKGDKVIVTSNAVLDTWETQEGEKRSKVSFTVQRLELINRNKPTVNTVDGLSQFDNVEFTDEELSDIFGVS